MNAWPRCILATVATVLLAAPAFADLAAANDAYASLLDRYVTPRGVRYEGWRANGAEELMSGRIGDTIEFYYLDTAPTLKFVLESGSGHAIDIKPTYVYP